MFFKTGVFKNFAIFTAPELKPLFNKVSGLKACFLFKKETPTQVFFWEYCEIFKNAFFIEDLFVIPFRNFI